MRFFVIILLVSVFSLAFVVPDCVAQPPRTPLGGNLAANRIPEGAVQLHLTYVPRNLSREGDMKVVIVPATNPRQARLDAQTYHLGWDAIDAIEGQSRVMYEVLLRKRAPYVPGTPPVTRRIPR